MDLSDLKSSCITCTVKNNGSNMISIFKAEIIEGESTCYSRMLSAVLNTVISAEDELPKQICVKCIGLIRKFFSFQIQSLKALRKIRSAIESGSKNDEESFKNETNHKSTQTEEIVIHPCEFCELIFDTGKELKKHRVTHNIKDFNCRFCKKKFCRLGTLQGHLISVHPESHMRMSSFAKKNCCPLCSKIFTRPERMRQHMQNAHKHQRGGMDLRRYVEEVKMDSDEEENEEPDEKYILPDYIEEEDHENRVSDLKVKSEDLMDCIEEVLTDDEESEASTIQSDSSDLFDLEKAIVDKIIFPCEYCDLVLDTGRELKKHRKSSHDSKDFTCRFCKKSFCRLRSLQSHLLKHHPESKMQLSSYANSNKCPFCNKLFARSETMREHLKNLHKEQYFNLNRSHGNEIEAIENIKSDSTEAMDRMIVEDDDFSEMPTLFACGYCKKTFSNKNNMRRHEIEHASKKLHECPSCDKVFKRSDHLKKHVESHSDRSNLRCPTCGQYFRRIKSFQDHMKKHDADETTQPDDYSSSMHCTICNKSYTGLKYFKTHMKNHETPSYGCTECNAMFHLKTQLTKHMRTHSGANRYLCPECGKSFAKSDYLMTHLRRHRGEKQYKCRFCDKSFISSSELRLHERYHTGEKLRTCCVCGKGFYRASTLNVHMRTHTGEKPYKCPHCDRCFAQRNDLNAHVRRHTGERFTCEVCGMGFIHGYHLTAHKLKKHNIVVDVRNGRITRNIKKEPTDSSVIEENNAEDPPPATKLEYNFVNDNIEIRILPLL